MNNDDWNGQINTIKKIVKNSTNPLGNKLNNMKDDSVSIKNSLATLEIKMTAIEKMLEKFDKMSLKSQLLD